jgi:hypothetical protein
MGTVPQPGDTHTHGRAALREAARLERAAVYGQLRPDTAVASRMAAARAVADSVALEAALLRADRHRRVRRADRIAAATRDAVVAAVRRGLTTEEITADLGVDGAAVRAARKRVMRGAA